MSYSEGQNLLLLSLICIDYVVDSQGTHKFHLFDNTWRVVQAFHIIDANKNDGKLGVIHVIIIEMD
jgi:hypothetical protein